LGTPTAVIPVGTGKCIFISYSDDDRHFVPLLDRLLKLHHHTTWCSLTDLNGGRDFSKEIDRAICEADALIAVLSTRSLWSKWVTKEIAVFQAAKREALIIPLLLEPVDLDEIMPGLRNHLAIPFHEDMLTGFKRLFEALGNHFLSIEEIANRRVDADGRRNGADRRHASVLQRMRIGLVLSYTRTTGKDGFEQWDLLLENPGDLHRAIEAEVRRYEYFDHAGESIDPKKVLDEAVRFAWKKTWEGRTAPGTQILSQIAERICSRYQVRMIDRRTGGRRT